MTTRIEESGGQQIYLNDRGEVEQVVETRHGRDQAEEIAALYGVVPSSVQQQRAELQTPLPPDNAIANDGLSGNASRTLQALSHGTSAEEIVQQALKARLLAGDSAREEEKRDDLRREEILQEEIKLEMHRQRERNEALRQLWTDSPFTMLSHIVLGADASSTSNNDGNYDDERRRSKPSPVGSGDSNRGIALGRSLSQAAEALQEEYSVQRARRDIQG